jgi:hypothetical protein
MGNGGRGSSGKEFADWRSDGDPISDRLREVLPCQRGLFSLCENSNPNAWMAEKMSGHSPDSFGYSHMTGGNAGGQAEYARVPLLMSVPFRIADEKVLFLSTSSDRLHGCRKLQSPSRPYCGGRLSA